jgi:hypothetical protein
VASRHNKPGAASDARNHRLNTTGTLNRSNSAMQIANIKGKIGHGADIQLVTKAIADTGATDHLLKDRPSLQFCRKSHKRFWDYSGTIVKQACREGTQYLYAFNPNDIDEPGSALALAASTMKGITDDIISLPKIVKGMGYKCKLDGVDNGWEGLYRIDDKGNEYGHIPLVWDDKAGLWFIHFSVGESELAAFKNRRHRACVFRKQLTWKDRNVDYQPSIETTGMPQAARFEQLRDKIASHYAKRNRIT